MGQVRFLESFVQQFSTQKPHNTFSTFRALWNPPDTINSLFSAQLLPNDLIVIDPPYDVVFDLFAGSGTLLDAVNRFDELVTGRRENRDVEKVG